MPRGTLYESCGNKVTSFSFAVEVAHDVWASMTDGTLPTAIPAVVVEAPASGSARLLYDVLEMDASTLGPVRLMQPNIDPMDVAAIVPVKKGDTITIHVLGRVPKVGGAALGRE
jgi:hypothetical protein